MKLFLIRHGESTGDIEERFGGDYDDHLTLKGKKQARELAQQLKGKGIEMIFISPKLRARETAREVQRTLRVPLKVLEDLRERNNYGVLTGLTTEEAKKKFPIDFEKISKDKTYHHVTGSESYEQVKNRVIKTFAEILSTDHQVIAVITHGGIISTYVREVLAPGKNIILGDCAILEINKDSKRYTINGLSKAGFS